MENNNLNMCDHDYDHIKLRKMMKDHFSEATQCEEKLFKVEVEGLWDLYLSNIPEEIRQQYNCRACKQFIERYGNIVILKENGTISSPIWDIDAPDTFKSAVLACKNAIITAGLVSGILVANTKTLGTPVTGIWNHLSVSLPPSLVYRSDRRGPTVNQYSAKVSEEYKMLKNALSTFSYGHVCKAVALLSTGELYRGYKVLPQAGWCKSVWEKIRGISNPDRRNNVLWYIVAHAPDGFCHVKSSMLGSLLSDIAEGYSIRLIAARFSEKMAPENYQRSSSVPTASAIMQAEEKVEELGIADSLRRAYLPFDEIKDKCLWVPKSARYKVTNRNEGRSGVFSNIKAKERSESVVDIELPTSTMTYAKFSRMVLPETEKIEVLVDNPSRFMAMVTEAVPGSKKILRWDNPYSWYYGAGIDGEMKRRVEREGGRYEANEIRCSLMWNTYTDLDLHCVAPGGREIFFGNKRLGSGWLDVDMNVNDRQSLEPVENIRFADNAPEGRYIFYVKNYTNRAGENPFTVELEINGRIYTYHGNMTSEGRIAHVFEFDYCNGKIVDMKSGKGTEVSGSEKWNLNMMEYAEVKGIVKSPNSWNGADSSGEHTFFLLEGCKDENEGIGRGFFVEMLVPELKEIRKTLEAYTASTTIENIDNATACGVGYSTETPWDLTLRVTTTNGKRIIKIDRFD